MNLRLETFQQVERMDAWKWAGGLSPFLLILSSAAMQPVQMMDWLFLPSMILVEILALVVLVTLLVGFAQKLPRYSLPSIGLALYLANVYARNRIANLLLLAFIPVTGPQPALAQLLGGLLIQLVVLLPALIVITLLVGISFAMPQLRSFNRLLRRDSSTLPWLLYGFAPVILLSNDVYQGLTPYEIAGVIVAMGAAALYLRAREPRLRWSALVLGVTLSSAVVAWGIYRIYPVQTAFMPEADYRLWETAQPLITAGLLLLLMGITALPRIGRLFHSGAHRQSASQPV